MSPDDRLTIGQMLVTQLGRDIAAWLPEAQKALEAAGLPTLPLAALAVAAAARPDMVAKAMATGKEPRR